MSVTSIYENEDEAYCDQEARRERIKCLAATVPPRYLSPGDLHPDIAAWADGVADGKSGSLAVTGPAGTGKSWSMWQAAIRLVQNPEWPAWPVMHTALVLDAADFRDAVSPHAHPDEFTRLCRVAVLLLDDVGAVRLSEWDSDRLLAVIEKRWAWERPTAVTSNVADLRGLLGERIASRLADGAVIVTLDGEDRRRA